ncbi:tetratricopeptide repeat protein 30 [Marchantia polymorpha subsp. ruderalis]|uniref:Tetratricopeptide repeat protein 30 n=1 Tax=Marchantia polymorpha TaxID=3197 RepID=A0A2R6XMV1_MARPO|nr:hypothetical protein MARPO_0008s0205 [Marchantia polymorpha]BBN19378.1 hypothetical protein Mp_8g10170 [Marchantia polymorpha subsp. ruderalis]|eukprot:PTQ47454.1 hypothetical protein MARPO_0008s0205 [Marchantia polymorpha]
MAWGQLTATFYGLIRDAKYTNAIKLLEEQLPFFAQSQAALSLLAYCHYMVGEFQAAASLYEQLTKLYPTELKYAMYHAQSLYKDGMYVDAGRACLSVECHQTRITNLQACIRYEQGDISGSKMLLEQIAEDDVDAAINLGCCLYKEAEYAEALSKFNEALNVVGFQPELAYNKALCLYHLKLYDSASKILAEIFEDGVREHPELSVGSHIEGMDLRSVGNSQTLKESALVEAFNLKAAIEYLHSNFEAAKEALDDMPPRSEEELDCVTLHNQALMNMDKDPTSGFRKLNFLLQSPPFPPETFGNLLLLYCKPSHGFYDLAADVLAENAELAFKYLSQDLYDFLDATILTQTSTEDAYKKFNELANKHGETLRCLTKQIQNARMSREQDAYKKAVTKYEEALENYIPVIMAMAKIWWDKENYLQVERIFHQSADLCSEHDLWKLNVAHTFFMQDNRFKEAIHYYEPIVKKAEHNLFNVTAIVLANLCVCYIMTSRNEEAEELMRKIEKEEERAQYEDPEKQNLHLCIVNLVIGTLYCAKQNFEFGIGRIIKSLEPYGKKIEHDTWFYARRCFLALIDNLAKQMIVLKDATYADIDAFMDAAELYGKSIVTTDEKSSVNSAAVYSLAAPNLVAAPVTRRTVSQEARMLKFMFLKARD